MYKIPLKELREKILATEKITAEDFDQKIKVKINELSGLISEEGAAHIIANELGISLVAEKQDKLKIKEIYAGMRNVSTVGKVVRKFETREFQKEDRTGKVCSLILGDETGTIRVVFWNDQVDLVAELKEEDILLVENAYVRENRDSKEVHMGNQGSITINPKGVVIENVRQTASFDRKTIAELQEAEGSAEIVGTIVQVFDPRFFTICPQCNGRVREADGGFNCHTHGVVEPADSYVMNLVIDDGTGNIRATFWKDQTNDLLGKNESDIATYKNNPADFEDTKNDLLGEQLKLMGRVKKNDMFERLEFNVQIVQKADPQEELARLKDS